MKRYLVVFTGRVQGVGFRWTIYNLAQKYGFTGYVENLDNGNVECQLQGNSTKLKALINEIELHSRYIRIEDYFIKELPIIDSELSFNIR